MSAQGKWNQHSRNCFCFLHVLLLWNAGSVSEKGLHEFVYTELISDVRLLTSKNLKILIADTLYLINNYLWDGI